MKSHLLAVVRDEFNKMKKIYSDTDRFQSDRKVSDSVFSVIFQWIYEREMREVPVYLTKDPLIETIVTEDYTKLPTELREVMEKGVLRTSGNIKTDYTVLMPVATSHDGNPEEGRTGILLYRGEPVIIDIDRKEFIIEIKGVGRPDGQNEEVVLHERTVAGTSGQMILGSVGYSDAKHEFDLLEKLRKKNYGDFNSGNTPRVAALQRKGIIGLIYRLSPSNLRASFKDNTALHQQIDPVKLVTDVARQWVELARDDTCYIHSNIHPENILNTGNGFALTDYGDVEKLSDKITDDMSGKEYLKRVLNKIRETREVTLDSERLFYTEIAKGLGVEWDPLSSYDNFIDSIWRGFFARKIYFELEGNDERAKKKAEGWKSAFERDNELRESRVFFAVNEALNYFKKEIEILEEVNSPLAKRSLTLAKEREKYLREQPEDYSPFKNTILKNINDVYDFFVLPYMKNKK